MAIPEHDGLSRPRQDNAALATMVQSVDDSVGALVAHLASLDILENTYIFFFSDNGGLCTKRGSGPRLQSAPARQQRLALRRRNSCAPDRPPAPQGTRRITARRLRL